MVSFASHVTHRLDGLRKALRTLLTHPTFLKDIMIIIFLLITCESI